MAQPPISNCRAWCGTVPPDPNSEEPYKTSFSGSYYFNPWSQFALFHRLEWQWDLQHLYRYGRQCTDGLYLGSILVYWFPDLILPITVLRRRGSGIATPPLPFHYSL